jgi:MFS family permease
MDLALPPQPAFRSDPSSVLARASVWGLILLFGLANAIAFIDRSFLNLVVEPVRQSLKLSDMQIGLLIGPAFMIFYSLVALPIGWMSDTFSRKRIILAGLVVWTSCITLTGFSNRFWQLILMRMGIGIGEATLSPAAISIISDLVPRHAISRAVALFIAIGTLGAGLGAVIGGLLLGWLGRLQGAGATLPMLGGLAPWQQAFVLLGLPGIVLAAFMLVLVREPGRRVGPGAVPSFRWSETVAYLRANRASTLDVIFGFALVSALPAVGAWTPAFLSRQYGWTPAAIGPAFGLMLLTTNPTGIFLGGLLSDLLRRRGQEDANLRVIIACLAAALPFFLVFPLMPTGTLALWAYAPANFLMMLCFGASTPVISILVPQEMRAQGLAIMFLTGNLAGSLGPLIIPALTQYVFHNANDLGHALMILPLAICPLAVLVLLGRRRAFLAQVLRIKSDSDLGARA